MNRFLKTSLIASLAAMTSLAPVAASFANAANHSASQHDGMSMADPAGIVGSTGSNPTGAPYLARHGQPVKFSVVPVAQIDNDALRVAMQSRNVTEPGAVAKLQARILSDRKLARQLSAENVNIRNIVGAQRAFDGSVTYYVR